MGLFFIFFSKINTSIKTLGIQAKFFTLDQNIGISLQCILTKFDVSTPFQFPNIAVQNLQFFYQFSDAILSVFSKRLSFGKLKAYIY